jgi:hypothetical protein
MHQQEFAGQGLLSCTWDLVAWHKGGVGGSIRNQWPRCGLTQVVMQLLSMAMALSKKCTVLYGGVSW